MLVLWMIAASFAAPTVAIADLTNHTGDPALDGAGPGVAGILVSRFQGSGVVDVVERDALDFLLTEQQLTVEGLTEPRTAARAGRLAGADYVVVGELFSMKLPSISIALRVVDTETAEVVVSRDVVGQIGDDGERFFELIDALSTEILGAMNVSLREGQALSDIEQRELAAVLRYGEDLLRVNLDHPMALYRESDRDFERGAAVRKGWAVYDKRGVMVQMPELARRIGDRDAQAAYLARGRMLRKRARVTNLLTLGYGAVGAGLFIGGGIANLDGDTGAVDAVQLTGLGLVLTSGVHSLGNLIGQGLKRSASRRPTTYYRPDEVDRWLNTYNRSLGKE
ncbi:MAG: CsgG/HfaB family protein [Myxococcota bacterium]